MAVNTARLAPIARNRLPDPPAEYDQAYFRRLVHSIEQVHSTVQPPWPYMADGNGILYQVTLAAPGTLYGFNTQTGDGVPHQLAVHAKTASYTLAISDAGGYVRVSSSSPTTVTVPTHAAAAFPVGSVIQVEQAGTGTVTIAGSGGVTVNTAGSTSLSQYKVVKLVNVSTNVWTLF